MSGNPESKGHAFEETLCVIEIGFEVGWIYYVVIPSSRDE